MLKFGLVLLGLMFLNTSWLMVISVLVVVTLALLVGGFTYNLGVISFTFVDLLSLLLILLTFWITFLMFMMSFYIKFRQNYVISFSSLCLAMGFFLFCSFSTSSLMFFYIMFEASLIPIFLLVLGWGYQPERIKASYYLLFYTLVGSLPLLLGLFYIDDELGGLDFSILLTSSNLSFFLFAVMTFAFLIKMPVYFGHLWLPKAHVEAPVAGSMILAGVLLKLGGYGLFRSFLFMGDSFFFHSSWMIALAVLGGVLASLICFRQTDCKSLVAYSSVAHMALVLMGLFLNSFLGLISALIIMVAHGLCSSGLFALVGVTYERSNTRSLLLLRSSMTMAPVLALWWFLFSISNMAAPPTPNLAGEILVFISSLTWMGGVAGFVGVMSFLGAVYNLFLFSCTQHGNEIALSQGINDGNLREFKVLFLHMFPLVLILPLLVNLVI